MGSNKRNSVKRTLFSIGFKRSDSPENRAEFLSSDTPSLIPQDTPFLEMNFPKGVFNRAYEEAHYLDKILYRSSSVHAFQKFEAEYGADLNGFSNTAANALRHLDEQHPFKSLALNSSVLNAVTQTPSSAENLKDIVLSRTSARLAGDLGQSSINASLLVGTDSEAMKAGVLGSLVPSIIEAGGVEDLSSSAIAAGFLGNPSSAAHAASMLGNHDSIARAAGSLGDLSSAAHAASMLGNHDSITRAAGSLGDLSSAAHAASMLGNHDSIARAAGSLGDLSSGAYAASMLGNHDSIARAAGSLEDPSSAAHAASILGNHDSIAKASAALNHPNNLSFIHDNYKNPYEELLKKIPKMPKLEDREVHVSNHTFDYGKQVREENERQAKQQNTRDELQREQVELSAQHLKLNAEQFEESKRVQAKQDRANTYVLWLTVFVAIVTTLSLFFETQEVRSLLSDARSQIFDLAVSSKNYITLFISSLFEKDA